MSKGRLGLSDGELEQALVTLGRELRQPTVPDLASLVGAHLRQHPRPPTAFRLQQNRSRVFYSVAAAVVVVVLALSLSTSVGGTVASWFHIRGVLIESGSLPPGPLGHNLALGTRTTLANAQKRVGFSILVPTVRGLSKPDEVYVSTPPDANSVSLVYRAKPSLPRAAATAAGLLIGESAATLYLGKMVPVAAMTARVSVNGAPGFWIGGAHFLYYLDAHRRERTDTIRLAGNALVWQHWPLARGGVTYRLEGRISEARALEIARSMKVVGHH